MRKEIQNTSHVEGYIYEHSLEKRVSGERSKNPGTEFITGTLSIATDEDLLNVVPVHFTYVTALTKEEKPNQTFNLLQSIIDGKLGTVMGNGKENADKVRIDTAIALNEWYDKSGKLVSTRRNEGGFVHQTNELCNPDNRATFDVDMVITAAIRVEANDENNTPEKMTLRGCIFDFRGAILPTEFTVLNPAAMDYFESLDITSKTPTFTRLKGHQISKTIVREIREEGAFGEPSVKEVRNTQRDMIVTWAALEPYEWDTEEGILASELNEKMTAREVYLADIKKRQDEYQATKNGGVSAFNSKNASKTEYKF